jgi:hypothetical protein
MNAGVFWATRLRFAARRCKHFHCKSHDIILANDGPKEACTAQPWVWEPLVSMGGVPKGEQRHPYLVCWSRNRDQGSQTSHESHCCSLDSLGTPLSTLPEMRDSGFWCPYFLFISFLLSFFQPTTQPFLL